MTTEQTAYEIDLATAYERELEAQEQRRKAADYQKVLEAKRAENEQAERQEAIEEAMANATRLGAEYRSKLLERNMAINDVMLALSKAQTLAADVHRLYQTAHNSVQAAWLLKLRSEGQSGPELPFILGGHVDDMIKQFDHDIKPPSDRVKKILEV